MVSLANLAPLAGLAEGYQKQQDFSQRQRHNEMLMQMEQARLADYQRKQQQEQQLQSLGGGILGEMYGGHGGQGGGQPPPSNAPGQVQSQPLPALPSPGGGGGGAPVSAPWAQNLNPQLASGLQGMFGAARNQGIDLGPGSGYRTTDRQRQLYGQDMAAHGGKPSGMVAPPGHSQHERGMAMDVTSGGGMVRGGTPADQFMAQNAGQYGLQRPMAKEPWHVELQKMQPQADQTAVQAGQSIPRQDWGRAERQQIWQAIEKTAPGASPAMKFMAFERMSKLLAPSEKVEFQSWVAQYKGELTKALKDEVESGLDRRLGTREAGQDRRLGEREAGMDRRQGDREAATDRRLDKLEEGRNTRQEKSLKAMADRAAARGGGAGTASNKRLLLQGQLKEVEAEIGTTDDTAHKARLQEERLNLLNELRRSGGIQGSYPVEPEKPPPEPGFLQKMNPWAAPVQQPAAKIVPVPPAQ